MYNYLCFFFTYAFLGWCLEVSFSAVNEGKFVNRGFLNGPLCPIYGFGMLIVLYFLKPINNNILLLFVFSALLTTILEWITGFILEKIFSIKWWDYSEMPFNLNGYVCLKFSLMWGVACVFVIKLIHPIIYDLINLTPRFVGNALLFIFIIAIIIDALATVKTLLEINREMEHIDELANKMRELSDEIGVNIFSSVNDLNDNITKFKEYITTIKIEYKERREKQIQEFELLLNKYEAQRNKRIFGKKRLLKAFPKLKEHISNKDHKND